MTKDFIVPATVKPIQEIDILRGINAAEAKLLSPAIAYTVVLVVLGIVGNSIATYIYYRRCTKTTTRVFLLCVAVLDLINCVFTMPFEIWWLANFYYFPYGNSCLISRFITCLINNASSTLFVFIATERYMRICRANGWNFSVPCAKWACAASMGVGVAVAWPVILLYGDKTVNIPVSFMGVMTNVTGVMCNVKNGSKKTVVAKFFFLYLWFGFFACVVILTILYMLIVSAILGKSSKRRIRRTTNFTSSTKKTHVSHDNDSTVSLRANCPTTSVVPNKIEQPLEKLYHPTVNLDNENITLNNYTMRDILKKYFMSNDQTMFNGKSIPVTESATDNIKQINDDNGSDKIQNSNLHIEVKCSIDGAHSTFVHARPRKAYTCTERGP